MNKRIRKKGFTLIELIVVLAILVIAALFGVSSMRKFAVHSEQSARNQVARTIFMAAQTALTQKYNQDRNFYENETGVAEVVLANITPADSIDSAEHDKQGKIVYLASNPNNPSDKLISWLEPQINDKTVLNQAIVVEYNRETGRVLSAFYSEKEDGDNGHVTLGYGDWGSYNVYNRSAAALEAGFVGYYGVQSTGEPIRKSQIDGNSYAVVLRDYTDYNAAGLPYGVLTAEITLPQTLDGDLSYTLTLMPTEGNNEALTFSDAPNVSADFSLSGELMQYGNIHDAITGAHLMLGNRQIVAYYDAISSKLVFVLDCVESYGSYTTEANLGIRTNYPKILGGMLEASLEISDGADTVVLYSDDDAGSEEVHALYGSMRSEGVKTIYGIESVRHMNNIRYSADEDAVFTQEADVYFQDYERKTLNFTPLCNSLDPAKDAGGSYGFVGSFQNSGFRYRMFDLTVYLGQVSTLALENAGLFDTVRGSVSGVCFATTDPAGQVLPTGNRQTASITGINAAGGIAAVNRGSITNCTVLGEVIAAPVGNGAAGGIAGENSGTISGCAVAAHVAAPAYAGGIAGASVGTVARCEVGTASWRATDDAQDLFLTGIQYFGAHATGQSSYLANKTANNTFHVEGTSDSSVSGGVVGLLSGDGTVTHCLNAAKIEAGGGTNGTTVAGGVVGHIAVDAANPGQPVVGYCSNAGAVYAPDSAGGLVGRMSCGRLQHSYNSGYVNRQFEPVTVCGVSYALPGQAINIQVESDAYKFGGIVGYGSGSAIVIDDCYSAQYSGGRFGGAFGVMNRDALRSGQITRCSFLQNVLNDSAIIYSETGSGATPVTVPEVDSRVHRYSTQFMRTAPSDGGLDGGVFANGDANGVGAFKNTEPYTYPTITGADNSHRTPYREMLKSYGKIHSFARVGSHIEATFSLTPASGKLTFTVVPTTGKEFTITAPLSPDDFTALHASLGVELDLDATDADNNKNYMFRIKAVADNSPDAQYPYKYTVYLNYHHYGDDADDDLPEFTRLTAKLYNSFCNNGSKVISEATLANAISLTDATASDGAVWRVLRLALGQSNSGNVTVTLRFQDDTVQTVTLHSNKAAAGLDAAIADTGNWQELSGVKRFPFYATGSGTDRVLYLALWNNDAGSANVKPNGLHSAIMPVTVTVTAPGHNTHAQPFDKLEP